MPVKIQDKICQVSHQYQLFLQRVELQEDRMHPEQKTQLKQAFYAGFSQLLFLIRDDISKQEEKEAVKILDDMINQLSDYWNSFPLN